MKKLPLHFIHNNVSYSLCSKWLPFAQTHARGRTRMCVVEHATVELLGQWCSSRGNATPQWDTVSSGRRRESWYGRRVAGARHPTPHSPGLLGGHSNSDMKSTVLPARWAGELSCAISKLIGIFHIGNFCFWVPFLQRAAQCSHCKWCISYSHSVRLSVSLSVCPSVRPSHAGIVSKRRHIARCSLHRWIAKCV